MQPGEDLDMKFSNLISSIVLGCVVLVGGCGSETEPPDKDQKDEQHKPSGHDVEDTSSKVEFVYLDQVAEEIAAAEKSLSDSQWLDAFQHYKQARFLLHSYRSLLLPNEAGKRQAVQQEKFEELGKKFRDQFNANSEALVANWQRGEITYSEIRDLYRGVQGESAKLLNDIKKTQETYSATLRSRRNRGVCIYVHVPDNRLLEHYVSKTMCKLARVSGRPVYIWSNRSGERVSGTPWLSVRLELREQKKTYKSGDDQYSFRTELSTGYTVSVEVKSASGFITSWDSVKNLKLDVQLPSEMTYRSSDHWFPQYIEARARHLAAESASAELIDKLGNLKINPDEHEKLEDMSTGVTLRLLRARSAHAPDQFRKSVEKVLKGPSTPNDIGAVAIVLAESPHFQAPMSGLIAALKSLSQKQLDILADRIAPLRDIANTSVVLALISQIEGHRRAQLVSGLHFSEPRVREAAMPFADGRVSCVPASRISIAIYLINFTGRDKAVRSAFYRSKKGWLSDADPVFAARVADTMLSHDPDLAGELILGAIKRDRRSAAFLARLGGYSRSSRGIEITRKGYWLIPIADGEAQKRLATRLSISAGVSANDWKTLFKVAGHSAVKPENKKRIYDNLRRKSGVVGDAERAALKKAMAK